MAGKVIAVVNMKGGVGKTSILVGLAETLATEQGTRVLVMDFDAQASASYCIAGNVVLTKLMKEQRTADNYFYSHLINGPKRDIADLICGPATNVTSNGDNLDVSLLASSVDLRLTEREILFELTNRGETLVSIDRKVAKQLQSDLERLREEYAYILIDCAPGISTFTDAAIRNADLIIVPTIPDYVSHAGLTAFFKRVLAEERKERLVKVDRVPLVVLSKVRPTIHHRDYSALIRSVAQKPASGFNVARVEFKETADFPRAIETADDVYPPTYHQKYGTLLALLLNSLAFEVREAFR